MAADGRSPGVADADAQLGTRLRHVRIQQGLSLHDVEAASSGELKASVLGAYERGERTLSLLRLRRLAAFYRVPVAELLPHETAPAGEVTGAKPLVFDLIALDRHRDDLATLARFIDGIRSLRGDHYGRVLTVRRDDLRTLAAASGLTPEEFRQELEQVGVLR